jgi:hypothetical protein
MFSYGMKGWVLVAAASLAFAALVAAQQPKDPQSQKPTAAPSEKKPALAGTGRVSTDSALRDAAKKEAKTPGAEQAEEPPGEEVLEFHPAPSAATGSKSSAGTPKDAKKSPLRDVHGTVYGSTAAQGAQAQRAGGAVGASSKSGKTAIYVDTERSRATPPR